MRIRAGGAATIVAAAMVLGLALARADAIVGPSQDGAALDPIVVMVLYRDGPLAGFCSGIVVAPDAVLTAAHCVPPKAALKVHFREAAGPVLRDTVAVVRHPDYHANANRSRQVSIDLALVRLAAPLPARFRAAPPARRTRP